MAFDVDMKVFVDSLGPEAAKMLAEAGQAEKIEVETDAVGRSGVQPVTFIAVDGNLVNDFSTVKAESVIFEYWDYRAEIIKAAFSECQARAPVVSGKYRDSFFAILDGASQGMLEVPNAKTLQNISRVVVTNNRPYSRRLEVGVTETGDAFAKQVDPHIIQSAAKALNQIYGSLVKITFNFIDLEGAYESGGGWRAQRARKLGNRKAKASKAIRYPAIIIDQA